MPSTFICFGVAAKSLFVPLFLFTTIKVKPANILVNPGTLHLYLFDLGLARIGKRDASGELSVTCDGCTPAFAGPEMLDLFNQFDESMTETEKATLQQKHLIDVTSSDLWAAALSMLQGMV